MPLTLILHLDPVPTFPYIPEPGQSHIHQQPAMIEEISFKNVLSFRDETVFSFEAVDDTTFESSHIVTMPDGTRLLRIGIVFGPNASGKSNLLKAIESLFKFLWNDSGNIDLPTGIEPFLLDRDTPSQPSEYRLVFWLDDIRYIYELKAERKIVISEKLSFSKEDSEIGIFERNYTDGRSVLRFNPEVQSVSEEEVNALSLYLLPNKSVFAARGHVNISLSHVDAVRNWIQRSFRHIVHPKLNMDGYFYHVFESNPQIKESMLTLLHAADFNITGIDITEKEKPISDMLRNFVMNDNSLDEETKRNIIGTGTVREK